MAVHFRNSIVLSKRLFTLVSLAFLAYLTEGKGKIAHPNVIVFFADNLGYEDIGVFQSDKNPKTRTPNIDQLAAEGLKFTNWNSAAALCSASRASLLTGKYPVRTGVFPGVFHPDASNGLLPEELTIAEYLKEVGYNTKIVGKWHLGHQEKFLPTNQGFDSWYGIPYHMAGGSLDSHLCGFDTNRTIWLPLFENTQIIQQPVDLSNLAERYVENTKEFIDVSIRDEKPFFLYFPFSHVHHLCAPQLATCQWASNAFSKYSPNATFYDAVEEMDWILGEIVSYLDHKNISEKTYIQFTSDNGPALAQQSCSGSKGKFKGKWFEKNAPDSCIACPKDYIPSPTEERPHRCTSDPLNMGLYEVDGVPCGEDVGLGSCWEANNIMPAVARWPGTIPSGKTDVMVSTLDILPTILDLLGLEARQGIDGQSLLPLLTETVDRNADYCDGRILYFWRDGFEDGPLPPPFGRFDVVAAKFGRVKAWIYTKSAHYNSDKEVFHDPPLLFDIIADPAEEFPLDPKEHKEVIDTILLSIDQHKRTISYGNPLTLDNDPRNFPCFNKDTNCRTDFLETRLIKDS